MSLEDFHLLDKEPFGNSIITRDYLKICHKNKELSYINQIKKLNLVSVKTIIIIK